MCRQATNWSVHGGGESLLFWAGKKRHSAVLASMRSNGASIFRALRHLPNLELAAIASKVHRLSDQRDNPTTATPAQMIAIPTQRIGDMCSPKASQDSSGTSEYERANIGYA
jgi:hypothetical protein